MTKVIVISYPSGADLHVGGDYIGRTPTVVELGTKVSHEFRLTYDGYRMGITDVSPVTKKGTTSTVQFALTRARGGYNTLYPNPVITVLEPGDGSLPDFSAAYAQIVYDADILLSQRMIDRKEHAKVHEAIQAYFQPR